MTAGIPIIVVQVANSYQGEVHHFQETLKTLPQYLANENPTAVDMLTSSPHLLDIESLGDKVLSALDNVQMVKFDPHASSMVLQGQIGELASNLVQQAVSIYKQPLPTMRYVWVYISDKIVCGRSVRRTSRCCKT